jgi:hypothetical protein
MNDERPIEKLLRRAAQKRSDEAGPPPALHPANRRLLQGEVARQFPKPDGVKQSALAEFWAGLTQRRVYLIGVFAVLGVAAITLLPTGSKSKAPANLAQSTPSADREALEFTETVPQTPRSVAAPAVALLEADSARATLPHPSGHLGIATPTQPAPPEATRLTSARPPQPQTERQRNLPVANSAGGAIGRAPAASTAERTQPARKAETSELLSRSGGGNLVADRASFESPSEDKKLTTPPRERRKEFAAPETVSASVTAIAPTGAAPAEFAGNAWIASGGEREPAVFNSQAFSNINPRQLLARPKAIPAAKDLVPVLANFRIEQQGRAVQVVDGDGSVYRGVVDEENTLYKQVVDRQNQSLSNSYENKFKFQTPKLAAAPPAVKLADKNYYLYRVEGTNRSLNQNVVFTWNFVDTNALAAGNLNYQNTAQKLDATKLPSQFPALLQNSFINGRAEFGEGREIEVNAVPTTR